MARVTGLSAALLLIIAVASPARAADAQWPNIPGETRWPTAEAQGARWPSVPGQASQWPDVFRTPSVSAFTGELGLRYWFSWAKTGKSLYDPTGADLVSRLRYEGMHGHAVEGFGRFDHTSGFYTKGYVGGGLLLNGTLNDEDFPPLTTPYSSTMSDQKSGGLSYASVDAGFNVVRTPDFRLGAFAGYHYFNERINAFGCNQIATNADICGTFPVPGSIKVITQDNTWQSLRVGADFDVRITNRLSLRGDAAYLPYVWLNGTDSHWLRIGTAPGDFTGGVPEDGKGRGYQFEAALSYAVSENASVAVGGRLWHMDSKGDTHFENHIVGFTASPQPVNWKTDIVGVFVQGSFKFGPYATGGL